MMVNKRKPYKISIDREERGVREIIEHYENQTDDEAAAEDEAFRSRADELRRQNLSEDEIDRILTEEADELSKFGEPKQLRKRLTTLALSSHWLEKAKQLAAIHHFSDYREWMAQIVKERLQLEDQLYKSLQRKVKGNRSRKQRDTRAQTYKHS